MKITNLFTSAVDLQRFGLRGERCSTELWPHLNSSLKIAFFSWIRLLVLQVSKNLLGQQQRDTDELINLKRLVTEKEERVKELESKLEKVSRYRDDQSRVPSACFESLIWYLNKRLNVTQANWPKQNVLSSLAWVYLCAGNKVLVTYQVAKVVFSVIILRFSQVPAPQRDTDKQVTLMSHNPGLDRLGVTRTLGITALKQRC